MQPQVPMKNSKQSLMEADEDSETLKISESLLKSSASYRKSDRVIPQNNKKSNLSNQDNSLTKEVFGSGNCELGSIELEKGDDLTKAVTRKQSNLKSRRDKKAQEKSQENGSEGYMKRRSSKPSYKRPRNFA